MSIISSYCEATPEAVERFTQSSKGSLTYELLRLAQEVNASFGLEVGSLIESANRPYLKFLTPEGIVCGGCSVAKDTSKSGENAYRYYLTLPTISKEKASANSDRDTRDSVSLATLIRTIKKNAEEPTAEKLLRAMNDGMKYTMRAVANASHGKPRLSFDSDTSLAVARFILGVDSSLPNMYISNLQDKFNKFQSEMQSFEAANADYARYTRGVTLVCVNNSTNKVHYLVGDATFDNSNDRFDIQGGLKRYNSLSESPIADLAVMIKAYMQGTPQFDSGNDLGIVRTDRYFPEIDVATGYQRHQELWVAIPKHAQ